MSPVAAYDAHADWYEEYIAGAAAAYTRRAQDMLGDLLGPGNGQCLDVGCGTGVHASLLRGLGWVPVGVDLSRAQLRRAAPRMPAMAGDAAAMPLRTAALPAAVAVLCHTDVPDYRAVLHEIGRILPPGGRFVHLGVHPCFTGAFADRGDPARIVIDDGYADRSRSFRAWSPQGVRVRVGAWHLPLADLLNGVAGAGLRIVRTAESGFSGVPDMFGLLGIKD